VLCHALAAVRQIWSMTAAISDYTGVL